MDLNKDETLYLRDKFPRLTHNRESGSITGMIRIAACYNEQTKKFFRDHKELPEEEQKNFIEASFDIKIEPQPEGEIPKVYETGGKMDAMASDLGIPREDLHVNPDGSCCLGIFRSPARIKDLQTIQGILEVTESFFYHATFRARHGREPWPGLGHGPQGEIEHRKVGRNAPCPCGSGKKHKKCCLTYR